MITAPTHTLAQALIKEGFPLPKECANFEILAPIDGLFQARYVINLTPEDVLKIGRAMEVVAISSSQGRK